MGCHVKNSDDVFWATWVGTEDNLTAIGRPVRINLRECIFRQEGSRSAALARDSVGLRFITARRLLVEQNRFAVGGPARVEHVGGRIGELQALASVQPATPEAAFGIGDIGDLPAIFGEVQELGRNPTQKWFAAAGFQVEAGELATLSKAGYEDPFSVARGNWTGQADRAGG